MGVRVTALEEALDFLFARTTGGVRFGLERTVALLDKLGDPHRAYPVIHVAGTNGKGSSLATAEALLRSRGLRVGKYTSPHLVDFRERIRVDGAWADEARLARRLAVLEKLPHAKERTFFEVTTALAFDHFAAHGVEWAVVETGLGGRLDTTNVLHPELTVVSSIGLDHTEVLGATIEAIAREKAGIFEEDIPVISGVTDATAERTLEAAARAKGAPLVRAAELAKVRAVESDAMGLRVTAHVPPWGAMELETPLRGRHQLGNVRTALAALSLLEDAGVAISEDAVREGFAEVRWPGRLEPSPEEPRLWWDGAHNPDGMTALVHAWTHDLGFDPPAAVVLALSRDKDLAALLAALTPFARASRLIATRSRSERARPAEEVAEAARAHGWDAEPAPIVAAAVRRALAVRPEGRVLLAGSLFAVGEAMDEWGGAPGPQV